MKEEIKRFIYENKEGAIIGAVVGFLIGKYFLPNYVDFSVVNQTFGIIDVIKGATVSTIELAKTKIIWASTILGTIIGMIIDDYFPERWLR